MATRARVRASLGRPGPAPPRAGCAGEGGIPGSAPGVFGCGTLPALVSPLRAFSPIHPPAPSLARRPGLLTGAASGSAGRRPRAAAHVDARVVLTDVRANAREAVVEELGAAAVTARALDIADLDAVHRVSHACLDVGGRERDLASDPDALELSGAGALCPPSRGCRRAPFWRSSAARRG